MSVNKKKSSLGNNPLNPQSKGIFHKTENSGAPPLGKPEQGNAHQEISQPSQKHQKSRNKKQESRIKSQESFFLKQAEREKVNLRLSIEVNDWLDDLVKKGKRLHGHKIPKEVWVQAALEIFRFLPVNWESINSVEKLQEEMKNLESRINSQES